MIKISSLGSGSGSSSGSGFRFPLSNCSWFARNNLFSFCTANYTTVTWESALEDLYMRRCLPDF